MGDDHHHRLLRRPRPQLRLSTLLLPRAVSARRVPWPAVQVLALPHQQGYLTLQRLRRVRGGLPGRRRSNGHRARHRVHGVPELHQGLQARWHCLQVFARAQTVEGRNRSLAPQVARRGPRGRGLGAARARLRRRGSAAQPRAHPTPWRARRARLPGQVPQVRRLHEGLPHRGPTTRARRGRPGRLLVAHPDPAHRLLRTQLHPMRPGLPDRRHHPPQGRGQGGRDAGQAARAPGLGLL